MRINTPVTQNEYVLTDSDMIVSTTDLKGQITHINADFLRISGFTEQELLGQPHNIVRHPDMPPEAFADMWQNLKAGRPWTGLVKNRCKNGDYYWVEANATPISENGQVTGYMSVRRKPSRTQVEAAAAAYQKFRDGSAGRLAIRDGKVVKRGLFGRFGKGRDTTLKARLVFVVALMSVLLLAIGGLGLLGMSRASEGLRVVYEERTQALDQVTRIDRLILRNRSLLLDSATDSNPEQIRKNGEEIEQNIAEIGVIWKEYLSKPLGAEEKQWAERFTEVRGAFVQQGLKPALQMLAEGQNAQAVAHYHSAMNTLYPPVRAVVDGLVRIQTEGARHEYQAAQTRYQRTLAFSIAAMAIGLALALWVGILLIRAITRPLAAAIGHFARIAQGHYDDRIDIEHHDEIGKVLEALKSMQIKLGFDVAEAKRIADENLRIKIGLDNVSTGVMIADNQRKIIYANRAVVALLGRAEADIRKQLPSFSANSLVGTSIDAFHRQPAHQAQLLSTLTATHTSSFEIGGRSMVVAASPVINERGERLGAVAEWVDRTAEVAVEKEVADIVQAAARGDFSRRMALDGKDGFYLQLGEGINQFVATCATGMEDVARMLGALARGDLTEKISADYEGTFGQLKDDANSTAEKLTEIVSRIKEATDAINTAAKEIAAGNADLSQRTEEQATSLEETASSMEELTSTVKQNAENAKQANQLARGASDIAVRGGEVVAEVVDTMSAINDSSKKIVDIISVIDGIAFQTNILALNAAVEAARAGEQGRGFAVVAAEVRSLAQRSAAAAKEIKALISDSVSKVDDGSKLVANAGSTMEEIVNAVKRVTDIMAEISAASIEQSSGIEQVNQAVTQMDEVTQQNAALVEQAAAAAESMEEQAQTMAELVAVFRLDHEAAPQRAASLPQPARQALPKTSRETQRKPSVDKVLANIAGVSQEDEWDEF